MRHLWRLFAIFAAVGIANDVVSGVPGTLLRVSNLLVLLAIALLLANVFRRDFEPIPGLRVLQAGMLVFIVLAINANLVGMGLVPWSFDIEPLGFLVLACGLGWAGAQRVLAGERQLLSIEHELETEGTSRPPSCPTACLGWRG